MHCKWHDGFCFTRYTLALLLILGTAVHADDLEYKIKAAYLYNFARFVEWPEPRESKPFTVCILGQDPFGTLLDPLAGQSIGGQPLVFRRDIDSETMYGESHIVFIARSEREHFRLWLAPLHRANVLTVSDIDGFARAGGLIGLIMQGGKVEMEINMSQVRQCGLKISAKLLELATLVEE